jgi:hypothetical protein
MAGEVVGEMLVLLVHEIRHPVSPRKESHLKNDGSTLNYA